ncbi:hypothetical protein K491DRAFT_84283 [Lophiostoma macrostomum CBS 122681]|uniref:Uncharacterized protein n=1 Tax=Lophiostoma macrostomum CBS 122681 TaxID=1314788 RepID=A0A6A6SXJ0_9PLEO|nr:hypothetical protein K491DRAFT_84283 [Lophiostoma macrostomum CBS 122681]
MFVLRVRNVLRWASLTEACVPEALEWQSRAPSSSARTMTSNPRFSPRILFLLLLYTGRLVLAPIQFVPSAVKTYPCSNSNDSARLSHQCACVLSPDSSSLHVQGYGGLVHLPIGAVSLAPESDR